MFMKILIRCILPGIFTIQKRDLQSLATVPDFIEWAYVNPDFQSFFGMWLTLVMTSKKCSKVISSKLLVILKQKFSNLLVMIIILLFFTNFMAGLSSDSIKGILIFSDVPSHDIIPEIILPK